MTRTSKTADHHAKNARASGTEPPAPNAALTAHSAIESLPNEIGESPCALLAAQAYARWNARGEFPAFWNAIQTTQSSTELSLKLKTIFEFFCSMREPRIEGRQFLQVAIEARLRDRFNATAADWNPPVTREDVKEQIKWFSTYQVSRFEAMGTLLGPAFDAFAAGQLRAPDPSVSVEMGLVSFQKKLAYPRPHSAVFFSWSEFALAAISIDCDKNAWLRYLPTLLRAQYVYFRAHAPCVGGKPPAGWQYGHYTEGTWHRISPQDVAEISFNNLTTESDLATAATKCAKIAFPGGMSS